MTADSSRSIRSLAPIITPVLSKTQEIYFTTTVDLLKAFKTPPELRDNIGGQVTRWAADSVASAGPARPGELEVLEEGTDLLCLLLALSISLCRSR